MEQFFADNMNTDPKRVGVLAILAGLLTPS
jgi:hypothetical protein